MSLNRKRKKELRKLQSQANNLWESQQVLVGEAANIAREAGRQLGNFGREQVVPGVKDGYGLPSIRAVTVYTCQSHAAISDGRYLKAAVTEIAQIHSGLLSCKRDARATSVP